MTAPLMGFGWNPAAGGPDKSDGDDRLLYKPPNGVKVGTSGVLTVEGLYIQ